MHEVRQLDNSLIWAEINPSRCPCRSGWLVSDYDTVHRCALHGNGVPHPEDDGSEFDHKTHHLGLLRTAYIYFRDSSGLDAWDFRLRCSAMVLALDRVPTPQDWVNAAENISMDILRKQDEIQARKQGFSCALEFRWAEDARKEREEHSF